MKAVRHGGIGNYEAKNRGMKNCAGKLPKGLFVLLAILVLLTACAGKGKDKSAGTPKEAAQQTMEAIKELDLKTFNECTDNYEGARRNLIGIPVEKEYKVFRELLQPHIFKGRRYRENYRFAKKVVEELTWKIGEIKEDGDKARIKVVFTNKDISEAMGRYTLWVVEDMIDDAGIGAASFVGRVSDLINYCDDDLIRCIDETEDTWTEEIDVAAYKEDGAWKIHITDEFINAFMGNINSEKYPEEIEERLTELEEAYEEKAVQWAEGMFE